MTLRELAAPKDGSLSIMPKESQPTALRSTGHALMYCAALAAGVVLVVTGGATPVEASGYVSPFLLVFEGVRTRG
ncbi:hypothetical protein [Streptomyces venezuelae]|uniref:hypothetical protein n=1 Tax=Streptomyces venezuelae TaxID=54571 RepID=UPI0036478443